MLMIWVNVSIVIYLLYALFEVSMVDKPTLATKASKWLMFLSIMGVGMRLGKSLLFIIFIGAMAWAVIQKAKKQQKKNV